MAPNNSHEDLDGAVGAEVHVGDLLLPMWTRKSRRPHNSLRRLCRSLTRPMQMQDVAKDVCRRTNAANVMDLVTGLINAHPEEEREDNEEDNVDAADEEDAMLVEEVVNRRLVL